MARSASAHPAHPFAAWLRWMASAGGAIVALVVAAIGAEFVPMSPYLAYALGFGAVCASVIASAVACPPTRRWSLALAALPALVLFMLSIREGAGAPLSDAVAVTACLLLVTTLLGSVVGAAVEHPGQLLFVVIVSSAADVFSVFHSAGPSHAIVESEAVLNVMALPWPMLGTPYIEPFLGAGDAVFTALFVAASRKHGLPVTRTLWALALAYAGTMFAVLVLHTTIPALPFLGLAMVLAHPAARRPAAHDRLRGFAVSGLIVAAVALMFLL